MKKLFLLILTSVVTCTTFAQQDTVSQDSAFQLKEVEVKAARIVNRPDGLLYMPTEQQKASAANGFDLLGQLSMPMIRVDEVKHSVSSVDNKVVQLRLNGTLATKADLLGLDPRLIRSVEFINNPGVRYGDDIGYVLNVRTRRADEGYTVGTDLTNGVNNRYGSDMVYARWNHKNSELGLTYDFGYSDAKHTRYIEKADYLLGDGTHYDICREDSARRDRSYSNNIQLKYNLADSASYVFQATLSADISHSPADWLYRRFVETGTDDVMTMRQHRDKSLTPVLDLYFYHALGRHQSVTANLVGTSIATDEYSFWQEGTAYAYDVDGNTWSLTSEAVYENRLRDATLSFGLNHQWKYTRNRYTGDVTAVNNMHTSNLYLFGQWKGDLGQRLNYSVGLGVSNVRYRQGVNDFDYWLFRPKATLTYRLSKVFNLTYDFGVSQHISQIAMISDTRIRTNSREWTVGNPALKPNSVMTHAVRLALGKPRLYTSLYAEWRMNKNCNMPSYERIDDGQFLYRQKNQPHCNMLYVMNYTRWTVLPDKLTASFDGGICRFFNKGDDYNHCLTAYNVSASIQAYLGRWTLVGQVDNGWKFMEGETWNHQGYGNALRCSYRWGGCQLSLTWYHPLEAHPVTNHARLESRYIHKDMLVRSRDDGNSLTLSLTWRLNRGRKYKAIDRTMQNRDTQTGIL